ncbi:MAG: ribonuclease HI [Clostridiaceae bacterium]|nr:ribonuclease HI [Clostridiaceae bacterium]
MKKTVDLYTDGACSGNPGRGGYCAILSYMGREKVISEGYLETTNNRMELMAAIAGLEALKEPCIVNLYTDSKYLADAINQKWLFNWASKNWRKSDGKPVLNVDLWMRFLKLYEYHEVNLIWVKGHNGHEMNERCDKIAVSAYNKENLLIDEGYYQ